MEAIFLFGLVLAEDKTPAPATQQDILGVSVTLNHHSVTLAVDAGKAAFWVATLRQHSAQGTIGIVEAQRLAGRLAFGCAAVLTRLPRVRLSSLFSVAYGTK